MAKKPTIAIGDDLSLSVTVVRVTSPTEPSRRTVPGADLTADGIFLLAESYRQAAEIVRNSEKRLRFSDGPIRLLYLQALEGYLRAFLRHVGKSPEDIRSYQHDFAKMLAECRVGGLRVSHISPGFIQSLTEDAVYVRVRYDFDLDGPLDPSVPTLTNKAKMRSLQLLIYAVADLRATVRDAITGSGSDPVSFPNALSHPPLPDLFSE
jgi:hypothetical protein